MAGSPLQGQRLILTVSTLTSLGFMLIGYDNGLMGGLGTLAPPFCSRLNAYRVF